MDGGFLAEPLGKFDFVILFLDVVGRLSFVVIDGAGEVFLSLKEGRSGFDGRRIGMYECVCVCVCMLYERVEEFRGLWVEGG